MVQYLKSHTTIFLLVASIFSTLLLLIRVLYIDGTFLFLSINLGLAWVPYLLSYAFKKENISNLLLGLILFVWLLFFPNALYMVTDLFQLWPRNFVSVWFDLTLLLSFALTGLFLGFSSLKNFENLMTKRKGKKIATLATVILIYLGSQGVYFGRFVRLNSWEVFTQPQQLFTKISDVLSNPLGDVNFYGTTFVFAGFCYLLYYGIFHFREKHN